MKNKKLKIKNSGFTLIELMVATSVFMMVMLAAVGALLITSNAAKKAKSVRYAMDNVNYAMDSMSRNLRLGSMFHCSSGSFSTQTSTSDCPGGGSTIVFMSYNGGAQDNGYRLEVDSLGKGSIEQCDQSIGCNKMTSPDVNITDLRFIVRGSGISDGIQPSVLIMVKGEVNIGGKITKFALQTMASQRSSEL